MDYLLRAVNAMILSLSGIINVTYTYISSCHIDQNCKAGKVCAGALNDSVIAAFDGSHRHNRHSITRVLSSVKVIEHTANGLTRNLEGGK